MATPITCLCGSISQEVLLNTDSSITDLCHCNSCRTITGLPCSSYRPLQCRPKLDGVQEYQQSDGITRYFCQTCGAHLFIHLKRPNQYLVASGVLEAEIQPPKMIRHWGVGDTGDRGLSVFLAGGTAQGGPGCRVGHHQSCETEEKKETEATQEGYSDPPKLHARCHCGGINFYITQPDSTSSDASSPWPDLLVPYHTISSENKEDVKWWLREENTKYLVGTCACPSCRLASGFPIQAWAFIPKSNLFTSDSSALAFDTGTMQRFESSPRVYREFCARCGATVFWHCEERPRIIDVSVGLLRGASGVLAREWLDWSGDRVSFAEMAVDKGLIRLLENGLRLGVRDTRCFKSSATL